MIPRPKAYRAHQNLARRVVRYRHQMRAEARAGGAVFGSVPPGRRREFVCFDERTWFWHEEWRDAEGRLRTATTRYDVSPSSITKSQNGNHLSVSPEEALNLLQAARQYQQRVHDIYAS